MKRNNNKSGRSRSSSRAGGDKGRVRTEKRERTTRPGIDDEEKPASKQASRTGKPQEKPYKAGTRSSGTNRDDNYKGDRGGRGRFSSDRKRGDAQDKPYKAGTRPAGKRYGEKDDFRSKGKDRYRDDRYRRDDKRPYSSTTRFDKTKSKENEKTRLNKYIANSGICSRREADEYIKAGVVTVNGETITEMGYKVSPGDVVRFHDKPIRSEKNVYVLLNKPKDFITTTDDERNRRTVMNLLHGTGKERIYPVGRLDRATTGVLLFTNDGDLTKKLTHPSHEIKKIYQVELDKPLKSSDLEKIRDGIELEDGVAQIDEIVYTGETKKVVGIELHSGKNRIVRRIFEALDYRVVKLDRVYFAGLTKKDLPRGRWRFLNEMEVSMLKMLTAKKPKGRKE